MIEAQSTRYCGDKLRGAPQSPRWTPISSRSRPASQPAYAKAIFLPFGGDSYIFAVEFSQPLHAVSVMPYSQSADPGSPHREDQAALFADGKFKEVWFSEAAIAAHTERSYQP